MLEESLQQQLLTKLVVAASDSELPEVASAAGRVVKKIILDSKLVAEHLEKMNSAEVKQQPVATPGGMVLRSRRWVYQVEYGMKSAELQSETEYCKLNWNVLNKGWLGCQADVVLRMLFFDINSKESALALIQLFDPCQ